MREILHKSLPRSRKKAWEAFVGGLISSISGNGWFVAFVCIVILLCIVIYDFLMVKSESVKEIPKLIVPKQYSNGRHDLRYNITAASCLLAALVAMALFGCKAFNEWESRKAQSGSIGTNITGNVRNVDISSKTTASPAIVAAPFSTNQTTINQNSIQSSTNKGADLNVGKDAVVIGPASGNIADGAVVIRDADSNGTTILRNPMIIGRGAHGLPGMTVIGAGAGAGLGQTVTTSQQTININGANNGNVAAINNSPNSTVSQIISNNVSEPKPKIILPAEIKETIKEGKVISDITFNLETSHPVGNLFVFAKNADDIKLSPQTTHPEGFSGNGKRGDGWIGESVENAISGPYTLSITHTGNVALQWVLDNVIITNAMLNMPPVSAPVK